MKCRFEVTFYYTTENTVISCLVLLMRRTTSSSEHRFRFIVQTEKKKQYTVSTSDSLVPNTRRSSDSHHSKCVAFSFLKPRKPTWDVRPGGTLSTKTHQRYSFIEAMTTEQELPADESSRININIA